MAHGVHADAPEGRQLLQSLGLASKPTYLLMDRAYQGLGSRELAVELVRYVLVVPPKQNRKQPWQYDRQLYKRRNEVERLFQRFKGLGRLFTRFEKLDEMFIAFLSFILVVDELGK